MDMLYSLFSLRVTAVVQMIYPASNQLACSLFYSRYVSLQLFKWYTLLPINGHALFSILVTCHCSCSSDIPCFQSMGMLYSLFSLRVTAVVQMIHPASNQWACSLFYSRYVSLQLFKWYTLLPINGHALFSILVTCHCSCSDDTPCFQPMGMLSFLFSLRVPAVVQMIYPASNQWACSILYSRYVSLLLFKWYTLLKTNGHTLFSAPLIIMWALNQQLSPSVRTRLGLVWLQGGTRAMASRDDHYTRGGVGAYSMLQQLSSPCT